MLGQIIYNVEDYSGSGGLISTSKSTINETVTSIVNGAYDEDYINKQINIFCDGLEDNMDKQGGIFQRLSISSVTKLGIQAPPGTKFYFNVTKPENEEKQQEIDSLSIMIGRTGVYELDDGINISDLWFERPKLYALDESASEDAINQGRALMEAAKDQFKQDCDSIAPLLNTATDSKSQKDYWQRYQEFHKNYVDSYNSARELYIRGMAGIYKQATGLPDLHNVIIDFVYTTIVEGSN